MSSEPHKEQQQPKESELTEQWRAYLKESELKEYCYLRASEESGSFALLSKVDALAKKYEEEIRSRPTPAPAQGCPQWKNNQCNFDGTDCPSVGCQKARQTREGVLDTIFKQYRNRRNLGALDGTINNDDLEDIINSLRSTQHPGQEE